MVTINDIALAGANLCIHKEVTTITLRLVLLRKCLKLRNERFVESQTRDVSTRINTEAIHTHLNKLTITFHEVVRYSRVLSIQIHTVTRNLSVPTRIVIPVPLVGNMVPIVVGIIILALSILHVCKTRIVLLSTRKREVVVWQFTTIFLGDRNHTVVDRTLVFGPITIKEFAQISLSEVTRMVEHDVEDNLHTFCVRSVNEILKFHIFRLIATIYFREIMCMIAVVVITRSVLHDRSNPHSSKAKCLDVIKFLDQTFEVTTPSWVTRVVTVPAVCVVRCITVIETGGHHKID